MIISKVIFIFSGRSLFQQGDYVMFFLLWSLSVVSFSLRLKVGVVMVFSVGVVILKDFYFIFGVSFDVIKYEIKKVY